MTLSGELCQCGHDKKYHRKQKNGKSKKLECVATFPGTFIFCKCKDFRAAQTQLEENGTMAKEKKVKEPKVKRQKKVKEPKVETITKYELTAKESKVLTDKDNDSQLAIIYRTVAEHGPATFDDLWSNLYRNFQSSKAPLEKQKVNVRTYLSRLAKDGLVKREKVAA